MKFQDLARRLQGPNPWMGWSLLAAILTLWLVAVNVANYFVLRSWWDQGHTLTWPSVPGEVVSATVQTVRDGDRVLYEPKVEYEYGIGPLKFSGHRVSFSNAYATRKRALACLKAFPEGKKLMVYYNPAEPQESCLQVGVSSDQAAIALFLLPFNLVGWGLPIGALYQSFQRRRGVAGFPCREKGGLSFLSVDYRWPVVAAWLSLFFGSLVVLCFNAFAYHMQPDWSVLQVETSLLVLVAAGLALKQHRINTDPARAIAVDFHQRRIHLPNLGKFAWEQLDGFGVQELIGRDADGDEVCHFSLYLRRTSGELLTWRVLGSRQQAEELADWLTLRTHTRRLPLAVAATRVISEPSSPHSSGSRNLSAFALGY